MKKLIPVLLILVTLLSFPVQPAHADVAPPDTVPGSNLIPGDETTQVRMMAETVTLIILKDPADKGGAVAKTEAVFTMRNLGAVEERMQVRFPLSFFNGNSDGFGGFPEIDSIKVTVNGRAVSTRREDQPFMNSPSSYQERELVPWSVFDVVFPLDEDVMIEVEYTVQGSGYYPNEMFNYVLETGAGWNGTIGSAEIIVRLPYEATSYNVWIDETSGYSETTPGGVRSGEEIRWKFEDFEPTFENNFRVVVLAPSLWEDVLAEIKVVTNKPNDGEAWGRLGKAYKEIIRSPKGFLRNDAAGNEMFELSREAYGKCIALLPDDPLWRYGFADLLWSRYYWDYLLYSKPDPEGFLPAALAHLQTAHDLAPDNPLINDLLDQISYSAPEALAFDGTSYIYLALTATPVPPSFSDNTSTKTPPPTDAPASTPQTLPTPTAGSVSVQTPVPVATNPLCGSVALLPVLFGSVTIMRSRRR